MTLYPLRHNPPRPPVYVVGAHSAERPLVSPEHVKGHVRLLRAFYNLRITVEDGKDRRIPWYAMKMDKSARWRWFVHLAVERFERWVKSLQLVPLEKFVAEQIPPVDVWMVWHAYLLSPCWYAEDCERLPMLQQLRWLNMFVVGSINIGKVVQQKPSNARMEDWYKHTGTPFNPFEAMTVTENRYKQLECPQCRTMVYAPFVNEDGTGFSGENFSVVCPLPGCRMIVTHEKLAVAKFVRDLSGGDGTEEYCVAGSLYSPSGGRDTRHAKLIKLQLLKSAHFAGLCPLTFSERLVRLDRIKEIKEIMCYSLGKLTEAITTSLRNCPETSVTRVLSAYTDGSPFSVNLIDAVIRQCHFTAQIDELGWLDSGAFRGTDRREILEHSVMRYHAFLDLMTASPGSILVPTLDIDLVWHTHQLMASRYGVDCEMYIGHFVDHDLSIMESRLSSAFDDTCRAWQARFQVPYMQCGCTGPDDASVHKVLRLVRSYLSSRSQVRMALHPDHLQGTHPSSHNALLTFQTVNTGTFGKICHNCKRKEEQTRSSTPRPERKKSQRSVRRLESDWTFSVHSPSLPVYFERELPTIIKAS